MKAIVDSLEVKIKKLISLHDKIKQERETAINEVVKIRQDLMEKQEVIKNLDGYEKFLYFESGTYSWPKSNTQSPYTLFSYTSSEATTWLGSERDSYGSYGGQLLSA